MNVGLTDGAGEGTALGCVGLIDGLGDGRTEGLGVGAGLGISDTFVGSDVG